ncbi:MAG: cell envelope integrity protein TolA [Betaproteobacteria bacterium]|nr:cell envelope integrity protein TolA [Betaproteobacteria bacterium]
MTGAFNRPDVAVSGALALLVHVFLLSFLVMGVSWKQATPPKVVVELWRDLPKIAPLQAPPPAKARSRPAPAPRREQLPDRFATSGLPKSAESPRESSAPKPEPPHSARTRNATPKPAPRPEKDLAAIKLREAREAERKLHEREALEDRQRQEERRRLQEAMRREAERRLAEKHRRDAELRKADAARQAAEKAKEEKEAAERAAQEKEVREALLHQQQIEEQIQAAKERILAERKAAIAAALKAQKELDDYTQSIRLAIRDKVVLPPGMSGNPEAVFSVKLLPNGSVATKQLVKSSGVPAYDRAVEIAIDKAQPLPVPPDPDLFDRLRDLTLVFRPNE